ncbi:serine/threonine protein kinase [Rubripirellula amarantea]|nr:serine/threonine protein kinase [Rubripirellula amarantea]
MSDHPTLASHRSGQAIAGAKFHDPMSGVVQDANATLDDSWTGRTLGEYELGKKLGEGGNGEVFAARHRWLDRLVAIKFLKPTSLENDDLNERFRRESQMAAKLIHPHVVRATDGGMVGKLLFLVTDYVNGPDLGQLVQRNGPLRVNDACEIVLQASDALAFVASKNTVHRDVKPSNLMLDDDGCVKLLDLGLARSLDHGHTMTATGQVMGTIDYMAPEQAVDPRRVDCRADIYSLGCTLYFLLAGKSPYYTDDLGTLAAKLLATIESDPVPLHRLRRIVPRSLANFVMQMMDKDPGRRPQDYSHIRETLTKFSIGSDLRALLGQQQQSSTTQTSKGASPLTRLSDAFDDGVRVFAYWLAENCGFIAADPVSRAGQRKTYRISFQWLKFVLVFAALAGLFWYSGFHFEYIPADQSQFP